jgi:hypothetical protein
MYGAARLVKIHEEGPGVFTGQPSQREPKAPEPRVPWRNSKACKLLYADVQAGVASEEPTAEEINIMRPEYAAYDWEKFARRLKYIRESVSYNNMRAATCQLAMFIVAQGSLLPYLANITPIHIGFRIIKTLISRPVHRHHVFSL